MTRRISKLFPAAGPSAGHQRIVHVGQYRPDSADGVAKTLVGLVDELANNGFKVDVWDFRNSAKTLTLETQGGVRLVSLPCFSDLRRYALQLPAETRSWVRQQALETAVVHLHSVFRPENNAVVRLLDRPYIISPNGGYQPEVLNGRRRLGKKLWVRFSERRYVRSAAIVHAVSPNEHQSLLRTFPTNRVVCLPNAVSRPTSLNRDPRPGCYVFIGRLAVEQKGLDLLVEGFARFISEGQHDARLALVGPDFRNGMAHLSALIRSLGVQDHVRLTGAAYGGEKWRWLEQAYGFVHTSRWEGLPFSVLEALAAGVPVLATPGTNIGPEIDLRGAGVCVKGTPKAIMEGFVRLEGLDTASYGRMATNASILASSYSWPEVGAHFIQLYEQVKQASTAEPSR